MASQFQNHGICQCFRNCGRWRCRLFSAYRGRQIDEEILIRFPCQHVSADGSKSFCFGIDGYAPESGG